MPTIPAALSIGQRVAWYRRRRGISQEVLAGRVGRTVDWLRKIENSKIELDRLSVIRSIADALNVTLADLLAEPSASCAPVEPDRNLTALRSALMSYRVNVARDSTCDEPLPSLAVLSDQIGQLWDAYQTSRFGYVTSLLPSALTHLHLAVDNTDHADAQHARRLLALAYQLASDQLTKLRETQLAWVAADRGLAIARASGDLVVIASLLRTVTHALLSTGQLHEAVRLTEDSADLIRPNLARPTIDLLAVYGTLFLTGSMAAARSKDPVTTRRFLEQADSTAQRLGHDTNSMWTAFGPTNVAIHRVATAAELGNIQVAIDLGPRIDTSNMPVERRVRHALELARAQTSWNRVDDALGTLLAAERIAPEHVRHHFLSRQLVPTWIRQLRHKPPASLVQLARRLQILDA